MSLYKQNPFAIAKKLTPSFSTEEHKRWLENLYNNIINDEIRQLLKDGKKTEHYVPDYNEEIWIQVKQTKRANNPNVEESLNAMEESVLSSINKDLAKVEKSIVLAKAELANSQNSKESSLSTEDREIDLATLAFNIQELESHEAELIKSKNSIRRGMITLANSIAMNIDELQDTTEHHPLTGDPAKAGYVWKLNLKYPE